MHEYKHINKTEMARQVMNVSHVTEVFGEVHCTNCFLNNSKDLKSTMLAGRSFQIVTTLMLKKDVLALQWLKGLYNW